MWTLNVHQSPRAIPLHSATTINSPNPEIHSHCSESLFIIMYIVAYSNAVTTVLNLLFISLYNYTYICGSRGGAVARALTSHQCSPGSIPGPGVISGLSLLLVLMLHCLIVILPLLGQKNTQNMTRYCTADGN